MEFSNNHFQQVAGGLDSTGFGSGSALRHSVNPEVNRLTLEAMDAPGFGPTAVQQNTDIVDVYVADLDVLESRLSVQHAFDCLNHAERRACLNFQTSDRVREFVYSRLLSRLAVSRCVGIPTCDIIFEKDDLGKPAVVNFLQQSATNVYFNVAYSGRFIAVGVSNNREIGVDIESVVQPEAFNFIGIAKNQFTRGEADYLTCCESKHSEREFFRMWTCKEAILKALGVGLTQPMDLIDTLTITAEQFVDLKLHQRRHRIFTHNWHSVNGEYCVSVAHLDTSPIVSYSDGLTLFFPPKLLH